MPSAPPLRVLEPHDPTPKECNLYRQDSRVNPQSSNAMPTLGNPAGVAQRREKCTLEHHPRPTPPPSTFLCFGFPFKQFRSHFAHEAKGFLAVHGRENYHFGPEVSGCELLGT